MAWINDDMVLYHGCSDLSLFPNNSNGIVVSGGPHNISHNSNNAAQRADFGPGFYATSWLHQAKNWANQRVNKLRGRHPNVKAVILSMHIERNRFASLESLVFISDRDNYYAFVQYCRRGGIPHAALAHRGQPYDVVAGPVSMGMEQTLAIGNTDQVSFHTASATAAITNLSVFAIGTPKFDVTP